MPDLTNPMTPEPRRPCVACHHIHGGVNAEMNCMREEILRLRSEFAEFQRFLRMRAEIRALPPSSHEKLHRGKSRLTTRSGPSEQSVQDALSRIQQEGYGEA
jgi:hypothetical protein